MSYMIQEYQQGVRVVNKVAVQSYSIENAIRGYKGVGKTAVRLQRVILPNGVSFKRVQAIEYSIRMADVSVVFMEDKEIELLALLYGKGTV